MKILGISCYYHDSSATLLDDGKVISAAEEERFTRKKHDSSFPINAIKFCLEQNGLTINDIDYIAFYEKPILKFERFIKFSILGFPKTFLSFISLIPAWIKEKILILRKIRKKLKYKGQVFFINHHLSHAGSFFSSPYKKAAILTIDGVGEFNTSSYGYGIDNKIFIKKEINFPNSIGLLYSTITAFLGFSVNDSEYKVMGLSAYGQMDREKNEYYSKFKKIINILDDGSYKLDLSYFEYQYGQKMFSKKIIDLLGSPREKDSDIQNRHKDIAAALQIITEEVVIKILNSIYDEFDTENLVFAGGVALNSVLNGKIIRNTKFKNIWILPDPGDGGTSVGCALYLYNHILNKKRSSVMETAYLGPEFSEDEVRDFLVKGNIKYKKFSSSEETVQEVAKLIYEDKVIGWFQGRMEFGPRALGSRSILANPMNKNMQNILNVKVKHREEFRPFAPVIPREDLNKYFISDEIFQDACNYMLMVYPIKNEWRQMIPAVTHIDGSGRVQTITIQQNYLYYSLIKEFEKLSGFPILINTSFNVRGEPIVCTPKDAYNCMMGTEIDYLVMGNYIVKREENLRDVRVNKNIKGDKFIIRLINFIYKRRKELILSILSLLIILLFTETILRVTDSIIHNKNSNIRDDYFGWVMRPNKNNNSLGFRDEEFKFKDLDSSNLIYAIGDSFTYGIVDYKKNIFTLVDEELKDFNVINLGVPGYGTSQYFLMVKKYSEIKKPKYIFLNFYVGNDFREIENEDKLLLNNAWTYKPPKFIESLGKKSYFVSDLYEAYLRIFNIKEAKSDCAVNNGLDPYLCTTKSRMLFSEIKYSPSTQSFVDKSLAEVSKIIKYCKENNIKLIVSIFPDEYQVNKAIFNGIVEKFKLNKYNFDTHKPQQILINLLSAEKVPYIDLLPDFEKLPSLKVYYKPFNSHWNEEGNEAAAKIFLNGLKSKKLLDK